MSFALVACAEGGTNRRDAGPSDTSSEDSPGTDIGGGDTNTNTCVDDSAPSACEAATAVPVTVGGLETVTGVLPMLSVSDWHVFQIEPGYVNNMRGQGTLSIELQTDDPKVRMEVRNSCAESVPIPCRDNGAMGRDVLSYSFVDNQAMPGQAVDQSDTFTTRDVPWPELIAVRVYYTGGPVSCDPYTLRVSRAQ